MNENGFSLVELLIALIVTSIISVPVVRVIIDSSSNLQRVANEAAYNQQALQFMQVLQNDIKDSQDTFIFDQNYPMSTNNLCTSATSETWQTTSNNFTRQIATIVSQKLVYPNNYNNPGFLVPQKIWIGYEIKRVASSVTGQERAFEIWRNECSSGGVSPTNSYTVLTMGNVLCANNSLDTFLGLSSAKDVGKPNCPNLVALSSSLANSSINGKAMFSCTGAGVITCPIDSSTRGVYKFDISLPVASCSPPILATLNVNLNCSVNSSTPRLPNPLSGIGRVFV
ncbi:MAG: type II secretion system protein J [Chitinophagaceae bacterium]